MPSKFASPGIRFFLSAFRHSSNYNDATTITNELDRGGLGNALPPRAGLHRPFTGCKLQNRLVSMGLLVIVCLPGIVHGQTSAGEWTWMGGAATRGYDAVYGVQGVPAAGNTPGGRIPGASCSESNGNEWIFGGFGYDSERAPGPLNDLWRFDSTTQQWTWMSGSTLGYQTGVWGTKGQPSSNNVPASLVGAVCWIDGAGSFWLFGGRGLNSTGATTSNNDMWEYSPALNVWTWIGGSVPNFPYSVYDGMDAIPGARIYPAAWSDKYGNFWIYGGDGYADFQNQAKIPNVVAGPLEDLWEYNPTALLWTYRGGSNLANQPPVYGNKGFAESDNLPGGREYSTAWTDKAGNFWLFGGQVTIENGLGWFNDLWEYDPVLEMWRWVAGSNSAQSPGVYGSPGVPAAENTPPSRKLASGAVDKNGDFWFFGGSGVGIGGTGYFDDLWEFNPSVGQWAWMGGYLAPNLPGVYGTKGVADPSNLPGGRDEAAFWADKDGNLWLFGGLLNGPQNNTGDYNDLWKFQPGMTPASAPEFSPAAGVYTGAQTVAINDATANSTIYYTTDGTIPTTGSTQYSGPITVSSSETIKAIATASGYSTSDVASAPYTINQAAAATPVFSPAVGTYTSAQMVTISDATADATIYYTTNGTPPTTGSTKFNGPISVATTETIEAVATATGYATSAVASATYTISIPAATPTFSVPQGSYTTIQTVSISDTTAGAIIYYTLDGSPPTINSTKYAGPITVSSTETIKAIAAGNGFSASAVASATYTVNLPAAATPTFSLAGGAYSTVKSVSISDTTTGAAIYYTVDGSIPTTNSMRFTTALTVSSTETIRAIATATGFSDSAVASATYTINLPVATPAFSPAAGTYTSIQIVAIADATAGATIYYTTNGTTPTASSAVYSGPVTVSATETIQAMAAAKGYTNSATASAKYTITLPAATPTLSPLAGTYTSAQKVIITDATPGAVIYYTTNGSAPTVSSTKYTGPVTVSKTETIQAMATAPGYSTSNPATAAYIIALPAATPAFSPAPGTYTTVQKVTISDATAGATIYYTTDGTAPTTGSTKYNGPITVASTQTLKAAAIAANYSLSAVASATYTLTLPAATPVFSQPGGMYPSVQLVTISDDSPGTVIYYTTNSTTPTISSTRYTGAITVSSNQTLKALAGGTGYLNSTVAAAAYTIVGSPTALAAPATLIGTSNATLNAIINGQGLPGTYVFQYGLTADGLTWTTASTPFASGQAAVNATAAISALATKTKYFFQVVVSSAGGVSSGAVLSFTTN